MTAPTSATFRLQPRAVVTLSILMSWIAASLGGAVLWELSMAGFPDGHRTQYERMAHTPMLALAAMSTASSFYFFYLAVTATRPRRGSSLFFAAIAYACIMPGLYFCIQYYLQYDSSLLLAE